MSGDERWHARPLLGFCGLISVMLILAICISLVLNRLVESSLSMSTDIIGMSFNIILSVSLILVYYLIYRSEREQEDIMSKQTEIQESQQKLLEAQHNPILRVESPDEPVEGDTFQMSCSNIGSGIARNIKLDLEILVSEDESVGEFPEAMDEQELTPLSDVHIEEMVEGSQINSEVPHSTGYWCRTTSLSVQDDNNVSQAEAVVKAGENEDFESNLQVMEYSGPGASPGEALPTAFSSMTEKLVEEGYTAIGYYITVTYDNIINEEQDPVLLCSGWTPLERGQSFENIYDSSYGEVEKRGSRYVVPMWPSDLKH